MTFETFRQITKRCKERLINFYGKHLTLVIIITAAFVLLFAILSYTFFRAYQEKLNLELRASALKGGEYGIFLDVLVNVINRDKKFNLKLKKIDAPEASLSTINQLDRNLADIGLIQSNAKQTCTNVSSVAYIYKELYFLVSNRDDINTISDIAFYKDTLKIVRLSSASQTAKDFRTLINFYGIDTNKIRYTEGVYSEAYELLRQNKVDLGFFIVGLGNRSIANMLTNPHLHLVDFENMDAYVFKRHKLMKFTIPKGIYGLRFPEKNYNTFATKAMLIVNNDLSDDDVYKLTKALFEKEAELSIDYPFYQIEKIEDGAQNYISLHEGALKYYEKDRPSFINRNANLIATILSILGLIITTIPLMLELKKQRLINKSSTDNLSNVTNQ